MTNTITFIELIFASYLFVVAEPIEYIRKFLTLSTTQKTGNSIHDLLISLVNCVLCSGFWIGLIYYNSILHAAAVSICAETFCILFNRLNKWL